MGQRQLVERLAGSSRIALDTSSCIYYTSNDDPRKPLVSQLFASAFKGQLALCLSTMVQLELLVKPLQRENDIEIRRVMSLTENARGIKLTAMTRAVVVTAAETRAMTGMSVPDAIIVATAVLDGCDAIVGNDGGFARVSQIQIDRLSMAPRAGRTLPAYVHLDDYVDA